MDAQFLAPLIPIVAIIAIAAVKTTGGEGARMANIRGRSLRQSGLATMWLLAACSTDVAEESPLLNVDRGPAVLVFYGDTSAVQLPAATRVGQATTVRFTSFAGGCIRKDSTEAEVADLTAEVRAYRREPGRLPPNTACTAELRLNDNVVEVRFAKAGRARVRIVGLARPGDQPFVLERELEVTP